MRAAGLLLVAALGATAAPALALDFLYLAANEGGSSGGHVALRSDGDVFHVVHDPEGVVRLTREDADGFLRRHRWFGNRTVVASTLAVDETTARRVRATFTRRWMDDDQEHATQRALDDDARWLTATARRDDTAGALAVPALGYFFHRADDPPVGDEDPALAGVRAAVGHARGETWLDDRVAAARAAFAALDPCRAPAPERHGRRHLGTARRVVDSAARLFALAALREARPPRAETIRDTAVALGPDDRATLQALANALEQRAFALLDSARPDAGAALAVVLARLAVADASLRAGRWLVLDTFPDDAALLTPAEGTRHAAAIAAAVDANRAEFAAARAGLATALAVAPSPERAVAALERAANRMIEARDAAVPGAAYRLAGGAFVPARTMALPGGAASCPDETVIAVAASTARHRAARHRAHLRQERGYDLLTRNCVTELFRLLADAGVGESGGGTLDFIPVVANATLTRHLPVAGIVTMPSRRVAALAALRATAPPALVALREGNVLTAASYDRNPDDSLFLFFTDGSPLPRPLLGAANVGVGVGAAAAGLLTWPLDGGHLLASAARGVLFSLPELAFVNVRKGTYDAPPPELPGAAELR